MVKVTGLGSVGSCERDQWRGWYEGRGKALNGGRYGVSVGREVGSESVCGEWLVE